MSELLKLKGIGPVTLEKLGKIGIYTVEDLLKKMPADYVDLDAVSDLNAAENGDFVVFGVYIEYAARPVRRGRLQLFRARGVTPSGGKLKLTWYNANYVSRSVYVGAEIKVYGKLKKEGRTAELINPAYMSAFDPTKRGIKPIYALRGALPQATFAEAVRDATAKGYVVQSLVAEEQDSFPLNEAIRLAHIPDTVENALRARERVELERVIRDVAAYRLVAGERKRTLFYGENTSVIDPVVGALPFKLTVSQKEALAAILSGMCSDKPLNAMVVGDVGSGKTVVALLAAYFAVKCGYQAALMAPTEILAQQHFRTFSNILEPFGVKVRLLTAGLKAEARRKALSAISVGAANVVIGTHAVISKGVEFKNLSLVIVDEQHRFGVAERTALLKKSGSADTLTLSATPIPRSLRLTMFGDMDVLNIERRYSGNVSTHIVTPKKRKAMLEYIGRECISGKQAYIVAPKIYDVEGIESASVQKLYKELNAMYAPALKTALLYGKMKAEEKQAVLDGFYSGEISVLVSTTVIEVGIDVPNASIMAVFDADRFGLAALHQLRGRVGRNGEAGSCFLYTEKSGDEIVRLEIMTRETDGLDIAERDLELRGAGEWLGEEQSGRGGAMIPLRLMAKARELADAVDLKAHREELLAYALAKQLYKISLS